MEIKLLCDCGQKYKFDVEPVNGRMPFTVNCPICGVDGTPKANATLASAIAAPVPPPIPVAVMAAAAAPTVPPAVPAASGAIRINRPVAPTAVAASVSAPVAYAGAVPPLPPPIAAKPAPIVLPPKPAPKEQAEFNMGLGIIGALAGAALGMVLMYGFFHWAGFKFPWFGVTIGALTGFGARLLSRGTDMALGAICGAIALIAVIAALYFMYGDFVHPSILLSVVFAVAAAYRIASG